MRRGRKQPVVEIVTPDEFNAMMKKRGRNKYHAMKHVVDGVTFDSGAETTRYGTLKQMQDAGLISGLICHPRYPLPGATGLLVSTYVADFAYLNVETGAMVTEDVKGKATRTSGYLKNVKLLWDKTGIMTTEVLMNAGIVLHERDAFTVPKPLRTYWGGKDRTNG
ncbi:MAG: DUF1064 domain-containing protein [Gemmatimonadaceae bacterium]